MERVEEQTEAKGRGREHITRPPSAYYRNVYLDRAGQLRALLADGYQGALTIETHWRPPAYNGAGMMHWGALAHEDRGG